jgi:hypothetical protein
MLGGIVALALTLVALTASLPEAREDRPPGEARRSGDALTPPPGP